MRLGQSLKYIALATLVASPAKAQQVPFFKSPGVIDQSK